MYLCNRKRKQEDAMSMIKFNSKEILPTLARLASVVDSKNTLPILSNIKFFVKEDGALYAEASDGQSWVFTKVPTIEHDKDICFCVNAADFFHAVKSLSECVVEMTVTDMQATLVYDKGSFTLPLADGTQAFPDPIAMYDSENTEVHVTATQLATAITKVLFAVANDEVRQVMNGVCLDFADGRMTSVATDGRKLSRYKADVISINECNTKKIILPTKACMSLLSILDGEENEVVFVFNNSQVRFVTDDNELQARLIEGNYPNYNAVIPQDGAMGVKLPKTELLDALKRVIPMGNVKSGLVRLSFSGLTLCIFAEDKDYSKSAKGMVMCDYTGEGLEIGFNGAVLSECLRMMDGDEVFLELRGAQKPGVLSESFDGARDEYLSMVMPMMLN